MTLLLASKILKFCKLQLVYFGYIYLNYLIESKLIDLFYKLIFWEFPFSRKQSSIANFVHCDIFSIACQPFIKYFINFYFSPFMPKMLTKYVSVLLNKNICGGCFEIMRVPVKIILSVYNFIFQLSTFNFQLSTFNFYIPTQKTYES